MKKVVCIFKGEETYYLTYHKIYDVIDEFVDFNRMKRYTVMDNDGMACSFYTWKFMTLSEFRKKKLLKIKNSII